MAWQKRRKRQKIKAEMAAHQQRSSISKKAWQHIRISAKWQHGVAN